MSELHGASEQVLRAPEILAKLIEMLGRKRQALPDPFAEDGNFDDVVGRGGRGERERRVVSLRAGMPRSPVAATHAVPPRSPNTFFHGPRARRRRTTSRRCGGPWPQWFRRL